MSEELQVGAVSGYRVFGNGGDLLTSTGVKYSWTPGDNEALCLKRRESSKALRNIVRPDGSRGVEEVIIIDHGPIPDPDCDCGFWIRQTPVFDYGNFASIHALVEGWGHAVQATKGWRVEFARITAIIARGLDDEEAQTYAGTYGVPLIGHPDVTRLSTIEQADSAYEEEMRLLNLYRGSIKNNPPGGRPNFNSTLERIYKMEWEARQRARNQARSDKKPWWRGIT